MHQFHFITLLIERGALLNNITDEEFDEMTDIDPTLVWIFCVSPEDHMSFSLDDRPIHNHFLKGIVLEDAQVAAHVTINPTNQNKTLQWISSMYWLPDFSLALSNYLSSLGFQSPPPTS